MRVRFAITIAASLLAGEAAGSSILQVEEGAPASSPSIMVFAPPAVSRESVAAIDSTTPTVLRGGVYGDALPAPVVEPEPVKKLSRPAQRAKERAERRAIREAIRFGEPLPKKAETDQESGT